MFCPNIVLLLEEDFFKKIHDQEYVCNYYWKYLYVENNARKDLRQLWKLWKARTTLRP